MKNLEQQFSENLLVTQSLNSVREYSDPIPYDLFIEILLRVPTKSVCRFHCVSKSWRTILGLPYFTELFLTKFLARPRLLFHIQDDNENLVVFSSPQPQYYKDGEDYSLVATRYNNFPKYSPSGISPPLGGLVFLHGRRRRRRRRRVRVVCNPVTGESITLPRVKAKSVRISYFGYDPINKQFKVLCMTCESRFCYGIPPWDANPTILTLGTGKRFWRSTIECEPQDPSGDTTGTCINGVLYYEARFEEGGHMMVCFDFSSEKFSFIDMHQDMFHGHNRRELMNYKGRLCVHYFEEFLRRDELVLWVLEDAKWSKRVCVLPLFCGANIRDKCYIVGMIGTGEIVFTPFAYPSSPCFYLVFYNMERNTFTRVIIHGLPKFNQYSYRNSTFLDYVESMKTLV